MPHIRPITDLRNTTEISELCHAKKEPIFITKNGYGDLVIMSIETYEALTAAPAEKREGMCFLAEKDVIWAGVLADVLKQHQIPFARVSSVGGPGHPGGLPAGEHTVFCPGGAAGCGQGAGGRALCGRSGGGGIAPGSGAR